MPTALVPPIHDWQYDLNISVPAQATDEATMLLFLFELKQALVGFSSNPWTVESSSDSGSTADSDLWIDASDVVGVSSSGAHSWIVLRSPAGVHVCIDGLHGGAMRAVIAASLTPFSGGSTTARPTSDDETVLITGAETVGYVLSPSGNTAADHILQVMHREDGLFTYVFAGRASLLASAFGFFGRLDDPSFPDATVATWLSAQGLTSSTTTLTRTTTLASGGAANQQSTAKRRLLNAPTNGSIPIYPSGPCSYSGTAPADAAALSNDFVGGEEVWDAWWESQTSGERGIVGRLPDAKIVRPQFAAYGDHLLIDGDRHYAVVANTFAIPWDPATTMVSP